MSDRFKPSSEMIVSNSSNDHTKRIKIRNNDFHNDTENETDVYSVTICDAVGEMRNQNGRQKRNGVEREVFRMDSSIRG